MARQITATPPVKGKAAEIIQREILLGTPDTTERRETIRRADEVYRKTLHDIGEARAQLLELIPKELIIAGLEEPKP